jgi:hypothetical protein
MVDSIYIITSGVKNKTEKVVSEIAAKGFVIEEVVLTFYNVAPTSFIFLKISNHYHNITPKGAFFKPWRSVIMIELFINYALHSSISNEITIITKVKTTSY